MDTALAFSAGYALHTVNASLKLELFIHVIAADSKYNFLKSADITRAFANEFHFIAMPLNPAAIHAKQIGRKQTGFVTAGSCTDFDDGVFFVVGVFWRECFG